MPQTNVAEQLAQQKELIALASWIKENYTKAKQARAVNERQWRLNYAFYRSKQHVVFNTALGSLNTTLMQPKAPPHRVRHTTNRIKPIIRTELARLISNKPNASVVPSSSDDKDLFAAQAGEQLWESLYYSKKLHSIYSRAAFWLCITGTGFVKVWWDSGCTVNAGVDSYGNDIMYKGDIQYGAVSPFHVVVPDLTEEDIEDQPYVFNVYTKPVEWVNSFFQSNFTVDVAATKAIMGESFFTSQSASSGLDSVLVIEAWFKPGFHKLFPHGGFATVVNDRVVTMYAEGMPFKHGDYPFTKFSHIPTGEFYSDSVIVDLIDPQREFNRTRSQIIESKNRMAKPQLLAAQGSIDPTKITTQPGQVILYKPGLGGPPTPLPLQPIPSYVLQELDRTISDMEDISSQHKISRGQAPAGVTAATAISYLQERDDSPLTVTYQSVEDGWEKIARHSLAIVREFWTTARLVNGTGIDGMYDAIELKGSDVASGLDIRMEAGSALPVSKAAKQAFLLDMMKAGFIDPSKGLSLMNMGGVDKLYDELKADERQAKRENLKIRSLDVAQVIGRLKRVEEATYRASLYTQQQQLATSSMQQDTQPEIPPEYANAQEQMAQAENPITMQQPVVELPAIQGDAGFGQDTQSGSPLIPSRSIVPVNTWDNHQAHIEVHNLFRKSQAFELLPEEIKQQFEAHVMLHAQVLNQASLNAQAQMPITNASSNPFAGAQNGTGSPVGINQFSPPQGI